MVVKYASIFTTVNDLKKLAGIIMLKEEVKNQYLRR